MTFLFISLSLAGKRGFRIMALVPMHLRLETANGSAAEEYRIRNGSVELRQLSVDFGDEGDFRRLTAEELTARVRSNTVVAHWLERRLGWQRLLRACIGEQDDLQTGTAEALKHQRAA